MTEEPPSMPCSADSADPISSGSSFSGPGALAAQLVVDVNIADKRWLDHLAGVEALAGEAARDAFLAGCGSPGAGITAAARAEIALTFGDDEFIRGLNARHRSINRPTNVLSFPAVSSADINLLRSGEGAGVNAVPELLLGDVVLGLETTLQEAKDQGKRLGDHVAHLVAHGVLHLLGFDHGQDDQAARMEELETSIMENLGIDDPYRAPDDGSLQ